MLTLYHKVAWGMLSFSPITYWFLQCIKPTTFGKHSASTSSKPTSVSNGRPVDGKGTKEQHQQTKKNLLPSFRPTLAWVVMESPNMIWILHAYHKRSFQEATASAASASSPANGVLLSLFAIHYFNRCILYPFRISPNSQPVHLKIIVAAFIFCTANGWLQTMPHCHEYHTYPPNYHKSLMFITGTILFFTGFVINLHSDHILRKLRSTPPYHSYKIPQGGAFSIFNISCANFFGEIVEWAGFAMASGSLGGLAFWVYTCANLIPRACAHHLWYHEKFEDYPKERFAVIPFIL